MCQSDWLVDPLQNSFCKITQTKRSSYPTKEYNVLLLSEHTGIIDINHSNYNNTQSDFMTSGLTLHQKAAFPIRQR